MKANPPTLGTVNSYLYIVSCLKGHQKIEDIRSYFGVPLTTLSYHLKKLRKLDVIERISYGVWGVKEKNIHRLFTPKKSAFSGGKELRTLGVGRSDVRGGGSEEKFVVLSRDRMVSQDSVACHGLMFTFNIPVLVRWSMVSRRKYLQSCNIAFTALPHGERLDTKKTLDWKVQLFEKSLILYAPVGMRWYGVDAYVAFSEGLFDALRVIKLVEKLLKVDLSWSGRYKWKTSREHHALLGNALAQQYTRNGEHLFLRDEKGLWGLIDASIVLGEFETVRAGKDGRSANKRVQDCFNEVKDTGFSPKDTLLMIDGLARNAKVFGEHMKTHVEVMMEIRELIKGYNNK